MSINAEDALILKKRKRLILINHLFYSHSSVNTNRKFHESYFFSLWDVDFWVALQSLSSRIIINHKTDTLYNNTNKLRHRKQRIYNQVAVLLHGTLT